MTYEFRCQKCKESFELDMDSRSYHLPKKCPLCGSRATVRRLYSPPNIHYKGKGFTKSAKHSDNVE